jgi:hypothetical protein
LPTDEEVDAKILGLLKLTLKQITLGETDLEELEFFEEKPTPMEITFEKDKVALKVGDEDKEGAYKKIPFTRVPSTHKLKFYAKFKTKDSQREIEAVGSAEHKGKTLEHSEQIEIPELDSLPDESEVPPKGQRERSMKEERMRWIIDRAIHLVEALVSLINAFINSGKWF